MTCRYVGPNYALANLVFIVPSANCFCRPGKKDCSTRSANPNPGYSMWAGVNSFFLYTLSESDQAEILKNLQALGVRLVRIFVSDIDVGAKGSSSVGSVDVEPSRVGVFNDAILTQIDNLMYRAYQHNIKLNIVFHDRYKVDCTWGCDAYSKQWGAYTRNQNGVTHDVSKWYSSSRFAKQYDQRMLHIIDHVNPHFGKAWKHLPDAIFGFGIQNEGQAHSPIGDPNWICARAKALKPHLSPGINVITGGGGDVGDSTLPNHFACPSIDIVAVHSYDAAAWSGAAFIRAVETAIHAKKRLFVEEFGAQDFEGGRAGSLASQIRQIVDAGVPFIPWQLMKPGTTDFEFYTNTEETWSAFVDGVGLAKSAKNGWFSWPEFGIAAQSPEVEFANQDSL
ncbi:glycoside hydrolase superfamily [Cladochytrium replicatum]|nr:glycoside hydrolase superfamily [Cladochytrium replicatum]